MSSSQHLREFIRERLTVAAEEIFSEFEKSIIRCEEKIRLLDLYWKPQIKLQRIGMDVRSSSASLVSIYNAIKSLPSAQGRQTSLFYASEQADFQNKSLHIGPNINLLISSLHEKKYMPRLHMYRFIYIINI